MRMMQQCRENRRKRARSGESMLMVVAMMLVFFLLGAAVLTASSTTAASASARVIERQGYYYARSMADTLDESLQHGELGAALNQAIMRKLQDAQESSGSAKLEFTAAKPFTMRYQMQFDNDSLLSELNGEGNEVIITCTGSASVTAQTGGNIASAALIMRAVEMEMLCTYRGMESRTHIRYTYSGSVTKYGTADEKWVKAWTIQQAG